MRKLLVILLISVVFCRYDYELIKNAFNCLKEKGFLDKIKTYLFIGGELVAIEKCATFLQYCPVVKPSEEPSEEPEPEPEPTEKPSDEQTDKPSDKPSDKPLETDSSGDILLPEIRRLQDFFLPPSMSFDVNANKTDDVITDGTDDSETDISAETDEPEKPDEEQMIINRAICLRIFGYLR